MPRTIVLFAAAYFGAVFAAGFVLGVIRVLWAVPALGERAAELVELPVMILVAYCVAHALLGRMGRGLGSVGALAAGFAALALLVAAELAMAFTVRGLTPPEYVTSRDPISGSAYAAALIVFALLPAAIARRRPPPY